MPAARVRPRQHARLRGDRRDPRDRRGRATRVRGPRRGRSRRGAPRGEALRSVPARGRGPPDAAGHRAGVRAAGREAQPGPRPRQVPGRPARHRRVPAAGAGRTAAPRPRRALDGLARRPAGGGRSAAEGRRAPCRRAGGAALRGVVALERLPAAPTGIRGGDDQPAPGRRHRRPAPGAGRRRPPVRRRHRAHHRRTERGAAPGARVGPAGPAPGAGRPRPRPARRAVDRRRHRLPGHRHLQARHRLVAGPRGRDRAAGAAAARHPGRGGPRPPHQDQRLLQLVRPAPRQPTSGSTA